MRSSRAKYKHATPLSRKLVAMVKEAGVELPGDDEFWVIERTYCGAVQKSAGAWTFTLEWSGSSDNIARQWSGSIGSQWPASYIVKHGVDSVAQNGSIYPKDAP
jgi:hypothetical protein